ncbi:MAG: CHASE2 domain-containing protein [Fibrobacter sp.]|uniref:CHASE2 domain-containing protein n=1 Tax=Fibrobacter sp. TaxID=35828 RepID=UPI0025C54CF1|nr:CHASE2 domain-containing protein [Fibrobacter sp.]MBR4785217.1 CHASE2 domain-containing protein [Fibrobacter sp.]
MNKKILKKIKKIVVGLVITAVLLFLILLLGNSQDPYIDVTRTAAEDLENFFYDQFFKIKTGKTFEKLEKDGKVLMSHSFEPNIIIVDIDENALTKLGNYNEWDRSIHANVIKNLNDGGASAIAFDILFKSADFGQKKAEQTINILNTVDSTKQWDSLFSDIRSHYNFDSLMIKEIRESGNAIMCFMMDDSTSFNHKSVWEKLATFERAEELGFNSTFNNSQVDSITHVEPKTLLDNIYPELAQAGALMGSVNAYPDDDGVVRHVSMLYRFPNPYAYPDIPSRVYSTMSLMTVLHLFHQDPKNVKIKMGNYIDLGKPFGIYRDSAGGFHATYPQFSYPMFLELRKFLKRKDAQHRASEDIIDITNKVIATKNKDGEITFSLFDGQVLDPTESKLLLDIATSVHCDSLLSLKQGEETEFAAGVTITREDESESNILFIVNDTNNDEEITITPNILHTISYYKDSLSSLPVNKPKHLSIDIDLRYDKSSKKWVSNIAILNDKVIRDIIATSEKKVDNLKPGEEYRFGPIKRVPIDNYGRYLVNYIGRYNTDKESRPFQHLSYYDVTKNRHDQAMYQGKVFILGSAAPALFDFVPGPHEENNPAVLIHATIIQNILNDNYIVTLAEKHQQFIVILLAILCMVLGLFIKSYISIAISFLLMSAYTFIAFRYFQDGMYIGVSKQLIAMLITNIAALIVQFYYENKEKRFLDNAFKQYISPELIDEMVNNEIMPTLGGEKSNITAFFTDIASFSTFSEKIGDPSRLVDLLNEYLTAMTDTLLSNKGTLDKYEGDAIIAFFGAPMPLENHAQSACSAACDMQSKLMKLRKKWTSEGDKWPKVVHDMHMRIGINSGDIVTGNMGSTMRKNYTMMGDAVNLASRLESAAKQYGAYIQISEDTQKHLEPGKFIFRSLDTIRVVGKSLPVKTFELLAKSDTENRETLNKLVEIWETAREAYLEMDWDKAQDLFTQCLEYEPHLPERDPGSKTCPSLVYIQRCIAYRENPPVAPGETWDGVFTATSK